jgi:hypothetical protein
MRRRFNTASSFLDILFNIILGFFVLLMLAITVVNPPTKQGAVELKAEISVIMEWPDRSEDDVDLFVKTPASRMPVYYGNRDIKVASLDRDDLGLRSDMLRMSDGTLHQVFENWERVAIRKQIPGEYIVNVLMYAKINPGPTTVKIKVEKLNPYRLIFSGTIDLSRSKEEVTAVRFKIDKHGNLLERSRIQQSLVPYLKR